MEREMDYFGDDEFQDIYDGSQLYNLLGYPLATLTET